MAEIAEVLKKQGVQAALDSLQEEGADANSPSMRAAHAALDRVLAGLTLLGTDEKYGYILCTATASPAHPGEPVVPLRGRDVSVVETLNNYGSISERNGALPVLLTDVVTTAGHIRDWQRANSDLVAVAD
jgi:hypothetical protein